MECISIRIDKAEKLIENINLHSVDHKLAQALEELTDKRHMIHLKTKSGVCLSTGNVTRNVK